MSALRSLSGAWTTLSQLLALTAVLEILGLTSPLLTQWLVDETGGPGGIDQVFTMGLAFLVLQIVQHGVTYLRTSIAHYFGCDLALTRKTGFLGQMLALPQSFFEMRSVGDVAAKFASVDAIQQSLLSAVGTFAIDGAVAIACLGIMLFYHSDLAAISLCSIACIAILRAVFFFRLRDLSSDQIEHSARSQTHLIETLRGVRVIQLFGKQKDRKKAWHNLLITQYNSMYRAMRIRSNVAQLCALISSFECISVLCFGAASVISGAWSTGALMAYAAYRTTFSSRASLLLDKILDLVMLRLHFDRLEDVIDGTKGESVAKRQEVTVFDASEGIHLNALTFRYAHGENTILRGASLSIGEGECIAFVGASGCGKTTLIKILLGTLQPTRGDVYIGGQSGDSLMSLSRLGLVAAVMQDDSLFAGSIEENIHCFDSDADLSQVTASAVAARIHDEIMAMPMGYMTLVGDMGSTLSGGQRQRIALARALYRRPKLLILDEATSHLDVANEKLIGEAIRELRITRILVAHRPETIASADRVIEIRNGELIEIRPKQL
ncbi:peptidase domain-containing ABC transporter [Luteibacter sp. 22Crub2.1]|uniref:peptidase domain-containing ABC transporter n=1 Tax=Luteibacter sp. 22Crub2.1 TaxID=1283288 RepID=UPI0020CA2E24|nr:peptidase domain-containing ABC transporter [Luteibacter sp. 22Crub2.1]